MVTEFIIYINQNMNGKKQLIILFLMICIIVLLVKIDKYIDKIKKEKRISNQIIE